MVPIEMLSPGMRIKIVDQWGEGCYQNSEGMMDKYLGQVVTVLDKESAFVYIEEDAGEWVWSKHCFDYIVEDDAKEDFEPSSNRDILSLIFGD